MFKLYDKYLLPKITNKLCSCSPAMRQRAKIVPQASGSVLEIGAGTGLNFSFYDEDKVDRLTALEPSEEMLSLAEEKMDQKSFEIELLQAFAEEIPLEKNSIDTIVVTYTLCTIPDFETAFQEFKRVLKPDGNLLFCEHGLAPDKKVQQWQNFLNPIWKKFGGGCNLNRDIPTMLQKSAFSIEQLDTLYLPGFKPASYNYWGLAKPK